MPFGTIEQAIADISAGKFVVVADDEDRENEGDLICAAEHVTPEMVNFLLGAKGMICLALTAERCAQLDLPLMSENNTEAMRTAFTVSIDAAPRFGVSTGISAADRAATIRVAVDPESGPRDLVRPGHIHPLRARDGGVLTRVGHTEAAVDLARLAGCAPAGVICEILNEDGSTARRPQLEAFAEKHGLTFVTVAQLVAHRLKTERLVHRVAEARLPTDQGEWRIVGYRNDIDGAEHVALVHGEIGDGAGVLVRMHSKCLTGDVFHSQRCDCGWQLHRAMELITEAGRGVIVYLDQEGRGIGLLNKIKAYELQDSGADTVEANERLGFKPDLRNYGIGSQILLDLGLQSIRVLTNNPRKLVGVEGYGLELLESVRLQAPTNEENASYLATKRAKLGHLLAS
ncbi:bifunctional 3,4-dihydroxy-2-butanone-4-phosphate synthase/GTP cyclohydrolase II [Roseisolibacter sp. H3M3-2]|uniref:bifunctional 3,4-dihydroxy-2-butanone-4-phosphate synthase/GTP cyclohydrolase II n=1 Tax=Roseisolibacter sp. H3M3-2 TaxID=3031323 RepID=UPI0023DA78C0|nr:bifunctional 3,4-dihydroxy-2-butanone-4-phosphate synthase/GTP cyclohydrolase II [Roseisolibacter sp. H3M3-2]MDF1503336.1 bifunctional 3,4-dihydroxy-2-butanone-4-phosphate synthase/GTP cyclohydrolase II [Roseisolibacter sp. H3M3-2]